MYQFFEIYNKESAALHHAYFLVTHKISEFSEKLRDFLENKLGIKIHGNSDVYHRKYETFNIDHARELVDREQQKQISGEYKIFIIEADFITEEAQNSLLKVFEEPKEGTHFFIISPQDTILPTLRSRMTVFYLHNDLSENVVPLNIFSLPLKERLEEVKKISEEIHDEEKTKQDAINFVNQIEQELYNQDLVSNSKLIEKCERAREALYDRGSPIKIILENLVLSI